MEISRNLLIAGVPLLLSTTAALSNLLTSLDDSHICEGNRDGKFEKLLTYRGFTGSFSEYQLYYIVHISEIEGGERQEGNRGRDKLSLYICTLHFLQIHIQQPMSN